MRLSARNILKGTVKQVHAGAVNSEIIVELPGGQEIVAVITRDVGREPGPQGGRQGLCGHQGQQRDARRRLKKRLMRLHYLQHVPFEDAANIACWAAERGHPLSRTLLCADEPLPGHDAYDWLVIMGGPMNIYQHDLHPWLAREKDFIRSAIEMRKGRAGRVPRRAVDRRRSGGPGHEEPREGDRLVPGAAHAAGRWAARCCASCRGDSPPFIGMATRSPFRPVRHIVRRARPVRIRRSSSGIGSSGFQFHLDYSLPAIERMIDHCGDELVAGPFVQDAAALLALPSRTHETQKLCTVFWTNCRYSPKRH